MHQHPHVHNLWCIDQPSTCTCQAWRRLIKSLKNRESLQTTPWNLPRPQKNWRFCAYQARTSPVFPTIPRYHGCKASSGETLQCAAETLPVQASWLAQSSRQQWFWVYYRHATATSHAPRPLKRNWRHPEQVLVLSSRGNQLCSSCNSKVVRFLADTDLKWHLYIWRCLDSWNCAGFHDELEVCMTTRSEKCWLRIPMRVRAIQWQHLFVNGLNLLSLLSAWIVSLKKMQRPSPMEDASSNDGTPSPQLEVATADAEKPEKQPTEAQPTPRVEIRFGGMTHRQAWFSNSVHM